MGKMFSISTSFKLHKKRFLMYWFILGFVLNLFGIIWSSFELYPIIPDEYIFTFWVFSSSLACVSSMTVLWFFGKYISYAFNNQILYDKS